MRPDARTWGIGILLAIEFFEDAERKPLHQKILSENQADCAPYIFLAVSTPDNPRVHLHYELSQ
jgi:hypothetical protein